VNILDLIIIVAAVAYGLAGFRNGAVVGVLSMLGFFTGAVVGAQLAGPIGSQLVDGRAQVPVAIVCVLVFAVIGQLIGMWVGSLVRARFVRARGRAVDAGVGSLLGVASVLFVAWMVAVPLASSPYPRLAAQASHSSIVRGVNDVMPGGVRNLYSSLRTFLDRSGFPPVFGDLPSAPNANVAAPPVNLPPRVRRTVGRETRSVVKVYGQAAQCNRGIEGSGFVISPEHVMTNAHVVAGTDQVAVVVGAHQVPARVVDFDPRRDVAVLYVPQLSAPVLRFATTPAASGDAAIVAGYPHDGPLDVRTARVGSRNTFVGADIYGNGSVRRDVYAIRALVRSGNSGGPLFGTGSGVLGVVFATALDEPNTGYVLTASEVHPDFMHGRSATRPVDTGGCTPA
jgi:S1-C subfamily serine protease